MQKKEKIIFLCYFIVGMILNNITIGLPLFFTSSGYKKEEIGTLTAVLFLGSIAQPLVGYICDITGKKQLIAKSLFFGIGVVAICMNFFREFHVMVFLAFLISVFKDPVVGLLDDIVIRYTNVNGGNFGKVRKGASWGYALGLFAIMPFNFLFKNFTIVSPVLVLIPILSIIFFILQYILGDISVVDNLEKNISMIKNNKQLYKKEIKKKLLSKTYILLIIINLLISGTSMAKSSYQSLLLQSFGATIFILSLANFISIIPELLFMSRTALWLKRVSLKKILSLFALISILFNLLLAFAQGQAFVVSIIWLHGTMQVIFIPIYFVRLRNYLGENVSSSGLLINAMTQNLSSFLIGLFIIKPIFSNFGFTQLFLAVVILNLLAFVPISLLDKEL